MSYQMRSLLVSHRRDDEFTRGRRHDELLMNRLFEPPASLWMAALRREKSTNMSYQMRSLLVSHRREDDFTRGRRDDEFKLSPTSPAFGWQAGMTRCGKR